MYKFPFTAIIAVLIQGCMSGHVDKAVNSVLTQVPFNKVKLEDEFWLPRIRIEKEVLIPYAFVKTEPAVENLKRTANFLKGIKDSLPFPHRFVASDLYKVMEGASYVLMIQSDAALERKMDSIIDIIEGAQKPDGYMYEAHVTGVAKYHPLWGGAGMGDKPYSWEVHSHELYNMGHMYEGAIAYYQATGKDKWLKVAEKNARHINKVFFEGDPNYNNGKPVMQAPGHEELELALVKMYKTTGKKLYLDMAKKFLEIRGVTYKPGGEGVMAPEYAQQHLPVKEQREAVGHAVRAAYLYSGMADVSSLTNDSSFFPALKSIWENIVDKKMHITGGLGAVHGIEGFGPEYELPNKNTYDETCAAVGNVLFNYRMFLMMQDATYMDVAEIALLNNVLAGVNFEGNEFFYVNPLESDGKTPFNGETAGRSPWFSVACCPTNISRLLPQVPGMMYAHNDNSILCTLYGSSSTVIPLKELNVGLKQKSNYPFDGKVSIIVSPETDDQLFTVKLRIPSWARGQFVPGELYRYSNTLPEAWIIKVNGNRIPAKCEKGFADISRKWRKGDIVELELPMPVRFVKASDNVIADRGRISVTRGPLVYCTEGTNKYEQVQRLFFSKIPDQTGINIHRSDTGVLKSIPLIDLVLNEVANSKVSSKKVSLIPYYAWNNRGINTMEVWLPTRRDMVVYSDHEDLKGGKFLNVKASSIASTSSLEGISSKTAPAGSDDLSIIPWISNLNKGKAEWIEIDVVKKPIRSIGLYWFADQVNVNFPKTWNIEYKKDGKWLPLKLFAADSYGIEPDKYNTIRPASRLICSAMRINMLPAGKMVGVLGVSVVYDE